MCDVRAGLSPPSSYQPVHSHHRSQQSPIPGTYQTSRSTVLKNAIAELHPGTVYYLRFLTTSRIKTHCAQVLSHLVCVGWCH